MPSFPEVRDLFPATKRYAYLDSSARAPMADPVRAAIDAFLDDRQSGAYTKPRWFETVERVRSKYAELLYASRDEIAFLHNTSDGLNKIATGLPWKSGDNVVLFPRNEHPNNVYAWLNLRRLGVEVRTIEPNGAAIGVDELARHVDSRTRAITLTGVSFSTGGRQDIENIGQFCQERGIFFCVDAVQLVGFLDVPARSLGIDALSSGTNKGLLNLYGLGMLWVRSERIDDLNPSYLTRFGVDVPGEEEIMGGLEYTLLPTAKRFDVGNYNYLGIHGLEAALDLLLSVGSKAIAEHNLTLAGQLAERLAALDYTVVTPQVDPHRSQIVVFEPTDRSPLRTTEELEEAFASNDVRVSIRRGKPRACVHLFNDQSDIDRIVDAVGKRKGASTLSSAASR